jgi:hypothetical protein
LQLFKREARQARKVALTFAFEEGELSGQRAGQRGFTAAVCADKRPAFTRAYVKSGIVSVRVSLRRNVPCEICNDDMIYPIFCSNRCQGYSLSARLSMRSAQCGDNHPVCVEICGDDSTFF